MLTTVSLWVPETEPVGRVKVILRLSPSSSMSSAVAETVNVPLFWLALIVTLGGAV